MLRWSMSWFACEMAPRWFRVDDARTRSSAPPSRSTLHLDAAIPSGNSITYITFVVHK